MSILALPEELLERIIDFLCTDRASLHACALAHSRLRTPSQRPLFRELVLKSKQSAMRIGQILRATPALAASVRVLVLRQVTPGVLHIVLGTALPALHTLWLDARGALANNSRASEPRASLPYFESTRRLVIDRTDFKDVAQISVLLGSLPHVSALEFTVQSRVVLAPDATALLPPPPPMLALTHLNLRGILQPQVVSALSRWLCAPGSRALARLETLSTNAMLCGRTVTVAPRLLLETVAPTLKELGVRQHLEDPSM
jgi:hypothetical protein